jgi:hypothetical protein
MSQCAWPVDDSKFSREHGFPDVEEEVPTIAIRPATILPFQSAESGKAV